MKLITMIQQQQVKQNQSDNSVTPFLKLLQPILLKINLISFIMDMIFAQMPSILAVIRIFLLPIRWLQNVLRIRKIRVQQSKLKCKTSRFILVLLISKNLNFIFKKNFAFGFHTIESKQGVNVWTSNFGLSLS